MSLRKILSAVETKTALMSLALLAMLLWGSMPGSSVRAQTNSDQPLDAAALAALIDELKGVVAKSGTDEAEAAQVAARWDKRTDLAGKTKQEVVNLLYQDVKAVVKDSGVLYQINSSFAFYKRIPTGESLPAPTPSHGNMYEEPWHPAARFAVSEAGKKEKATVTLVKVEKADYQTGNVEGILFHMCLAVDVKKGNKEAVRRYARTAVFRNDKGSESMAYSVKSWKLSKTLPSDCQ